MTPTAALQRNAEAAEPLPDPNLPPPPTTGVASTATGSRPPRRLTLQQEMFVKEFEQDYGVDPGDIYFEGESLEPYFSFDALSSLAIQLAPEIQNIGVEIMDVRQATGLVVSRGTVALMDGRTRFGDAGCVVGDVLPNGTAVETIKSAIDVAGSRALQKALRMVGFDPVRAHRTRNQESPAQPAYITKEEEQRRNELAEIHILAGEAGLIVGDDKSAYYRQLGVFFPGVQSASELNGTDRAQFIALLRGIKSARTRAANEPR